MSEGRLLNREELVLAAMAAEGPRARFNAIQVQTLMFLLDRELTEHVDGPHFKFLPYHYGPFDVQVYGVLAGLEADGKVEINREEKYWLYWLTASGWSDGTTALGKLDHRVAECLYQCARWVLVQSWRSLLTEIYVRYPEMESNSWVPELLLEARRRRKQTYIGQYAEGFGSILSLFPSRGWSRRIRSNPGLSSDWHAIGDDLRNHVAPFPEFPR